jgi:hypothetical protein
MGSGKWTLHTVIIVTTLIRRGIPRERDDGTSDGNRASDAIP